MARLTSSTSPYLVLLVFFALFTGSMAFGNGAEDLGSSSSSSSDMVGPHLEEFSMGPEQTKGWTKMLNARLKDWQMESQPYAVPVKGGIEGSGPAVHHEMLLQRGQKGLLYLGMTPDGKRKVHAVFLQHSNWQGRNVAIVSTPQPWRSLQQKMQLHAFANVEKHDGGAFRSKLDRDYVASQLDALTRRIMPKTSQSAFDDLLSRFPGPGYK